MSAAVFPGRHLKPVKGLTDPRLFAAPVLRMVPGPARKFADTKQKRVVDRLAKVLERTEERALRFKAEAQRLAIRAERATARATAIEERIIATMDANRVTLVDGVERQFLTQLAPPALEVFDEKLVPADYMRTPKAAKAAPDRNALKAAFARDEALDPFDFGCKLTRRTLLVRR